MHFPDNVTRLCGRGRFSFACHPGVPCFTECCRELDLALTPYDVMRLCRELQIKPGDFIDRYVIQELDERNIFPVLYLGMVDDGRASCPFISKTGCTVYNGRPGACRAYPVGRGATIAANGSKQEIYVLVREEHCRGFVDGEARTAAEWFADQGLDEYNRMNDELLAILQHEKAQEGLQLTAAQRENFLLALYRLDEFRRLVESAGFQGSASLTDAEKSAVLADDLSLLRFGIRWLQETLFPEET